MTSCIPPVEGKMLTERKKYILIPMLLLLLLLAACSPKPILMEDRAGLSFREANASYYLGDYKAAEEKYKSSLNIKNDDEVLANLACLYKDTGRFSEAAVCYGASLKLKEDNFRQLNLALCLYHAGKFEAASAEAEKLTLPEAGQQKFERFYALVLSGCCAEAAGKAAEAEARFSSALKLNPFSAAVKQKLADAYQASGDAEKALGLYIEALRSDSSRYYLQLKIADIKESRGDSRGAYAALSRFSLIEPEYPGVAARMKNLAAGIPVAERQSDEKAQESGRKEKKCPRVRLLPGREKNPVVRVLLLSGVDSIRIKCGGAVNFILSGKKIGAAAPEKEFRVNASGGKFRIKNPDGKELVKERFSGNDRVLFENPGGTETFTIYDVTLNKGSFWSNNEDRSFRGNLEVSFSEKGLSLVNVLPLDEYLFSVVPSEISVSAAEDALKAQAVVARSYAYGKIGMKTHPNADVCAEVHCQAYSGVGSESKSATRAVEATKGELLLSSGSVVTSFFFSNCGGHTRNVEDVWSSESLKVFKGVLDFPAVADGGLFNNWPLTPELLDRWIKSGPDSYCRKDSNYRWFKILDKPEKEIMVVKRDNFGYIKEAKNGEKIFTGERVRSIIPGLRSNMVKFEGSFVYGAGWGHGVGMCQDGAAGMAKAGFSYRDILSHYFTESEVKAVY